MSDSQPVLAIDTKSDAAIKSAMAFDKILFPGPDRDQSRSTSPAADLTPNAEPVKEVTAPIQTLPGTSDSQNVEVVDKDALGDAEADISVDGDHPVGGDENNREFVCMNDEHSTCRTGQYTKKLSRKVISNHFGRNKACTRKIEEWPLFCRKHYQRATYKPHLWQRRKIDLITRQLDKIEALFKETTYKISLKKSEEARLNTYARMTATGVSHEVAAAAVAPDESVKSFQAPINVLRELDDYLGPDKCLLYVKSCVALILEMLNNNETSEVPAIEFLPQIPVTKDDEIEEVKKGTKAVKTKATKAAGRVSKKGAVRKPGT